MFLHLGNDAVVNTKDIVAIFDMDNTTVSKNSRKFLAQAQKNGQVVDTSEDLPKSYIVANTNGKTKVYISSVSSQTLLKRSREILY
ncbi:MAG TPA: DUF370 domain-containing protein [Candidatus Avimonoglobus intestinipullorum]|uniref:DUF370 domain-containing protein n=1 Tax=Candidatus Avimonoglobus intestinipullorum TaxID=2840699 RepID=A0A9D1S633_9FIRM|nr:DUF370 domain-containing protein [Candidatus Avimonoglobus intestinipullorum]